MRKSIIIISFILIIFFGYYLRVQVKPINAEGIKKEKIIVLGSQPECITAAVTARRLGYNVTLVTKSNKLGGLFTEGMLTCLDINYDNNMRVLHKGFFKEFLEHCSNGYNIDGELTEDYFNKVVKKSGIRCIYEVADFTPIVDRENNVQGVTIYKNGTATHLLADFVLDGSEEALFIQKLGVPYRKGRSDFGLPDVYAAASLIFSVKNADWNKIIDSLQEDNNPETHFNKNAAWGFNTMYQYIPTNKSIQMRGLNLSRQNDGSVVINGLLVYGADPTRPESINKAYQAAKEELPKIIAYLNKNIVGFENCRLYKVASKLYIREGIRIMGEDTLTGNDVYEHTNFPNLIAYGSYPMDLQSAYKGDYGNVLCSRSLYSIPLGVMIPKGVNNVLVLGRSSSFDIMAHGSARTVPVLMSMAEGGMLAVDYSLKNNIPITQLNRSPEKMREVHDFMKNYNGFELLDLSVENHKNSWYYPYIYDLRNKGFYSVGYRPYNLNETSNTKKTLITTISLIMSHSPIVIPDEAKQYIHTLKKEPKENEICLLLSNILKANLNSFDDLYDNHIISEETYYQLKNTDSFTHAHMLAILDGLVNKLGTYKGTYIFKSKKEVNML